MSKLIYLYFCLCVLSKSISCLASLNQPTHHESHSSLKIKVKPEEKMKLLARRIKSLPVMSHDFSTSNYKILEKINGRKEEQKSNSLKNIQKNLSNEQGFHNKVLRTAVSTDKSENIIQQSSGVQNIKTLEDIFHKSNTGDSIKKNIPKVKLSRKLNDSSDDSDTDGAMTMNEQQDASHEDPSLVPSEEETNNLISANHEDGQEVGDLYTEDEHDMSQEEQEETDPDFMINDLEKIPALVQTVSDYICAQILGDLQSKMMIKNLEICYEVYEDINQARKRYHYVKDDLKAAISQLVKLSDFLLDFVEKSIDDDYIKSVLKEKLIKTDEQTHQILIGLMVKLKELIEKFQYEIVITFKSYFDDLDLIHFNETISDSEKIKKMVQISSQLSIFQSDIEAVMTEKIQEVAQLCIDNPRYDHLSQIYVKRTPPPGDLIDPKYLNEHKLARRGVAHIVSKLIAMLFVLVWIG